MNLLFLILGLGGLFWLIHHVGLGAVVAGLRRIGWGFLAVCLLQLASLLLDAATLRFCVGRASAGTHFWAFARATFSGHAVNTLTPLGQLGEVTKYAQLASEVPPERAAAALLLQNLLLFATACAVIGISGPVGVCCLHLRPPFSVLVLAASGVFLAAGAGTVVLMHRGPGRLIFRGARRLAVWSPRLGTALGWIERVERLSRAAAAEPGRMTSAWILTLLSRLTGTAEIVVILSCLGQAVSPGLALLAQANGQLVSWTTAFVPLQAGTSESGAYLLFKALGLAAQTGVVLELVRKARRLVFAGIGVSLLAATAWRRSIAASRGEVLMIGTPRSSLSS